VPLVGIQNSNVLRIDAKIGVGGRFRHSGHGPSAAETTRAVRRLGGCRVRPNSGGEGLGPPEHPLQQLTLCRVARSLRHVLFRLIILGVRGPCAYLVRTSPARWTEICLNIELSEDAVAVVNVLELQQAEGC
jgi:hypothetical protein